MRMYLKSNKKRFFKKNIILIFFLMISIFYSFHILGKNLNHYYLEYSENEASRIITNSISEAVNERVLKQIKNESLYTVVRNKNDEIEMIDYNSYLVNIFLRDVTNNVTKYLAEEEEKSNNASFYIPMGSIFQNPLLNNRGPKIPVRMELVGSVLTGVNSKVTNYGINNSLIEIFVHIEVNERVILPVTAKNITIVNDIPISYRIIKGKIPSYYSGTNSSSSMYMMPIE